MKKTKLLQIIPTLAVAASAAPVILPLSSCTTQKSKDSEEKTLPKGVTKINLNSTTNLNQTDCKEPMFFRIDDQQNCASFQINIPTALQSKVNIWYQKGRRNNDVITWEEEEYTSEPVWQQATDGIKLDVTYSLTYRIVATGVTSADDGTFSNDTDQIVFSIDPPDKVLKEGAKLCGSALSLLGIGDATTHKPTAYAYERLKTTHTFKNLFNGDMGKAWYNMYLFEISPNFLPFTSVTEGCYEGMFYHSNYLKNAPDLPAATHYNDPTTETDPVVGLAKNCYKNMFYSCGELAVGPNLPAHKLAEGCYSSMFQYCGKLRSLSLGYVGNFFNKYFGDYNGEEPYVDERWLGGNQNVTLLYSGLDTDTTTTGSLIEGCKLITMPSTWISTNTKDIEVVPDGWLGTQTSIITGTKTKFRAYKTDTFGMIEDQIPAYSSLEGETDSTWLDATDTTTETEVDTKDGQLLVDKLPTKIAPTYEWSDPTVVDGWVNCNIKSDTTIYIKNCTITWQIGATGSPHTETAGTTQVALNSGNPFTAKTNVLLKANIKYTTAPSTSWYSDGNSANIQFKHHFEKTPTSSKKLVELKGSVMSLMDSSIKDSTGKNFKSTAIQPCRCLFKSNLYWQSAIGKISKDFLPSEVVPAGCYFDMFSTCMNLSNAPVELNATNLTDHCYSQMFQYCYDLQTGPAKLPATNLATYCYARMLCNCDELKYSPELCFTSTADYCCQDMFLQCDQFTGNMKKINDDGSITIKPLELRASVLKPYCYQEMFSSCDRMVVLPVINGGTTACTLTSTSSPRSVNGMFQTCGTPSGAAWKNFEITTSSENGAIPFFKMWTTPTASTSASSMFGGWTTLASDATTTPVEGKQYYYRVLS